MKKRSTLRRWLRWAVFYGLAAAGSDAGLSAGGSGQSPSLFRPAPADIARVTGLPEIGKWMIAPDGTYAHWRGSLYLGKALREPINVILIDRFAASARDAVGRLLRLCWKAGFKDRMGHSSGYWGWLAGGLRPQIPPGRFHAFSDEPFEMNNNHGRVFGPMLHGGAYYFIGSVSREKIGVASGERHLYVSFDQARDAFASALERKAGFTREAFVDLQNAILNDRRVGTGDHDGVAVLLTVPRETP